MNSKELLNSWKLAGIYFFLYILITFLISVAYSLTLVLLITYWRLNIPSFVGDIDRIIFPIMLAWIGTWTSSLLVRKRFIFRGVTRIAKISVYYYVILELILLIRDLLITSIDGIPIIRNYPQSIIIAVLGIVLFYYFTLRYLKEN